MSDIDWAVAYGNTVKYVSGAMSLINQRRFDEAIDIMNEVSNFIETGRCPPDMAKMVQKKLDLAEKLLIARQNR